MSEESSDQSTEAGKPPSGPAAGGDSPPRAPRSASSGGSSSTGSGGGDRGGYGDRGSRPSRDDRAPRAPLTVKGRLRAAARKKARKSAKKKGTFQRRKVCRFCADKNLTMSYKDVKTLRLFITETGKMTPRRISGTCAKHQRPLAQEIKRARQLAMLPYAPSHF